MRGKEDPVISETNSRLIRSDIMAETAKNPASVNPLGTKPVGKLLLQFGIPAIISLAVNAVYNLVDQIYIGFAIGMLGIAATNIAFPLTAISSATALLLGVGGASNFNLRLGEGNKDAADRFAGNALGLLAISGTVIGVLALIFLNPLLYAFGATETVRPLAHTYMWITAIGIPFQVYSYGACTLIRADGSPRYSMACMLTGAFINLIFDPITAFVLGWGIAGIAWATTVSQIISAIIVTVYFLKKTKTMSLKKDYLIPKAPLAKKLCTLGIASCSNQLLMAAVQITMNNIVRHYGAMSIYGSDIPLSCVGAISKINVMFLAFTVGIGQGSQPIHGFNYGAKKYDRVKKTLKLGLTSASIISVTVFIVFQLFPRQIMLIFGENDPLYLEFAVHYLRTYMFMVFANGLQPLMFSFFTSIGKATRGLWISLTRQGIFLLPLIVILPVFLGLDGVIYAGPIADSAAALLALYLVVTEVRKISALQREQASELRVEYH